MLVPILVLAAFTAVGITTYKFLAKKRGGASKVSFSDTNVFLAIKVPKENEKDALSAEQMFASLHGLLKLTPDVQEHVSFEIMSSKDGVHFYCVVPQDVRSFVESQIYAQYPNAQIVEVEDYTEKISEDGASSLHCRAANIRALKPQYFPIKTFRDFEVDPLSAVTSAIADKREGDKVWIQLVFRPIADGWQQEGYDYINALQEGTPLSPIRLDLSGLAKDSFNGIISALSSMPRFFFRPAHLQEQRDALSKPKPASGPKLSAGQTLEIKAIEEKMTRMGFGVNIRIVACSNTPEAASSQLRAAGASFKQFSTANLNSLEVVEEDDTDALLKDFKERVFNEKESFVLTIDELASVYHFPSVTVETPAISWSAYKRGESPLNLPTKDCTFLGKTTFRNQLVEFGIKDKDRWRHFYAIGKSGTGKSTLFYNMVKQDMENGKGVGVIDPHGETIDSILDIVPEHRMEDVVIFDPSDLTHPVSLNMLENPSPEQKNLMASGLVAVFKKYFGNSWGPRLEYLLNNAILTLLDVPNTTMLGIVRLLADDNYRKYITYKLKDPVMKNFWEEEYKEMKGNQKLITEALSPIQNKVGRFLSSTTIRNILGQAKSTINLGEIMDTKKIFLVNLAKGKIGEDNSNLLGAMIINRIEFMAMQRAKIPFEDRVPFYLFVDEFQNFASDSFASILSEARKYKLSLHLTHQYTAQLPKEMLDGVFGNVGTLASFALGAPDAKILASEFEPVFDQNDLISLEAHHAYIKMMIDGMTCLPFSAVTLPPPAAKDPSPKEKVLELSRQKYGTDVSKVEERIEKWFGYKFDLGKAIAESHKDGEPLSEEARAALAREDKEPKVNSFPKPRPEPFNKPYYPQQNNQPASKSIVTPQPAKEISFSGEIDVSKQVKATSEEEGGDLV